MLRQLSAQIYELSSFDYVPVGTLIFFMPIEIKDLIIHIPYFKQSCLFLMLFELLIFQMVRAKANLIAMFNNGVASSNEIEVSVSCVMDPDLM